MSSVTPYVLFLLAGLGFGYAAPGRWKLIPFAFPVALALGAPVSEGPDAAMLLRVVIAMLLTAASIALGALIDSRGRRREHPRYA